jgi:lipoyl(octanoyl) transferase
MLNHFRDHSMQFSAMQFSAMQSSAPILANSDALNLRHLGVQDYGITWRAMRDFTRNRDDNTPDTLWICQHPAVFTQGQAGLAEHIGQIGDIPLVQSDRGGQVTYHGLGQWVFYPLIDLNRRKLGVRAFVHLLEQITIDLLQQNHIPAERLEGAPGIYVGGKKIASLGLKVHKGRSYHGLALNMAMDLTPFQRIVPCGLNGMTVTQWQDESPQPFQPSDMSHIADDWANRLRDRLCASDC